MWARLCSLSGGGAAGRWPRCMCAAPALCQRLLHEQAGRQARSSLAPGRLGGGPDKRQHPFTGTCLPLPAPLPPHLCLLAALQEGVDQRLVHHRVARHPVLRHPVQRLAGGLQPVGRNQRGNERPAERREAAREECLVSIGLWPGPHDPGEGEQCFEQLRSLVAQPGSLPTWQRFKATSAWVSGARPMPGMYDCLCCTSPGV